ncbi:MAG: STAS/SEC14 domain-containing protein [Marinilabiliaceae bacterium]|nr:STAS/SEC14 domain-containing protein [Marinilabiliaceae bacterium]
MISYAYIDNILHVSMTKKVTLKDLIEFIHEFKNLENMPENLRIFYDLTEADLVLHLDDISKLSKLAEAATGKFKAVRTAFYVTDPKITAYTMLFSWLPEDSFTQRENFSTREAAMEWLTADE